jgi:protein-S-isoprenylcysteine O-methyltransferase Ste14
MARDTPLTRLLLRTIRPATSRPRRWNILKTLLQTSVFWLVFLAILPSAISFWETDLALPRFSFVGQSILPWVLFGLASALGLASGYTMSSQGDGTPLPTDCARRLVVAGPYRYVRNPMAIAGLAQGACVGLALGSPLTLLYVLLGGILWHTLVRPTEELDLARRFGAEYQEYQRHVRCWIPVWPPYRAPAADNHV